MLLPALALLAQVAATRSLPFEITNNKPFVQVTVDRSATQWFILDTGNNGASIIARECADRLQLSRGSDTRAQVGAGSGADVRISQLNQPVLLRALEDTLTVPNPTVLTLGHVAGIEGRRVDGLLGVDFMSRHVVELDYATRRITLRDTADFVPPSGAIVVPLDLETGWPIVEGTVTPRAGKPIRCRMIVDTGMRGTVTLFQPFSARHGLHDSPTRLPDMVTGAGTGGLTRGDVDRLDSLTLGPASFASPVAVYARDTSGIFALDYPEGIVGGEILRRHRVTFDYPHRRMILEPYREAMPFEFDMSGLFLAAQGSHHEIIRIVSVNAGTPAAEAGLRVDDEIVSIDGERAPSLTLDEARAHLRTPGRRRLEIRRDGQIVRARLETRRLI